MVAAPPLFVPPLPCADDDDDDDDGGGARDNNDGDLTTPEVGVLRRSLAPRWLAERPLLGEYRGGASARDEALEWSGFAPPYGVHCVCALRPPLR